MSDEPTTVALSIRLPGDAHAALLACAAAQGATVSEVALEAVYAFLADQASTESAARVRMAAETELSKLVLQRADAIRHTAWDGDVTLDLFAWIEDRHLDTYRRAIGAAAEHTHRINPQLAKRFAYAIGADYERDAKGKPLKSYLPRNANRLIQSYTRLRKPGSGTAA